MFYVDIVIVTTLTQMNFKGQGQCYHFLIPNVETMLSFLNSIGRGQCYHFLIPKVEVNVIIS